MNIFYGFSQVCCGQICFREKVASEFQFIVFFELGIVSNLDDYKVENTLISTTTLS
jgi:hypothetical protein